MWRGSSPVVKLRLKHFVDEMYNSVNPMTRFEAAKSQLMNVKII